jgi:hypothetical protein
VDALERDELDIDSLPLDVRMRLVKYLSREPKDDDIDTP